ncbi:MAG: glutathione S-transferase family protein [Ahrensia sp.]|nr:glutathione S-transferase family protein [Ahrensia sp.]
MLTLYSMPDSGNSYKPRLLLAQLGRPFRHISVDTRDGDTHTDEFLTKNPNGKAPLLELEDGRFLAESNAMLLHLAEGTGFLPGDAYERALVYQWLFFEQYSHEPCVAVRRSLLRYDHMKPYATPERLDETLAAGNKALSVMEKQLARTEFLAGGSYSVADISLYAYTHSAEEGGFELDAFPNVSQWLHRVANQPEHVPMEWLPEQT